MKRFWKSMTALLALSVVIFAFFTVARAVEGDEVPLASPVIYGDFNSWAIEGENACPLTETETGSRIFTGIYSFDAYTGDGDGYSLFTCITKIDYGAYGWGAGEQYKMNGEAAGFGAVSVFKPTVTGKYLITYTAATHVTTAELYEVNLDKPVIYGDFNTWAIEGENACPLTETGTDTGIFTGVYSFDAYTGDGDGYSLFTCISKINYGVYGWGAGEQYKMNGEAAGFGAVSIFKPTVTGKYLFTYTAATHVTTAELYEVKLEKPVIYGDFNSWAIEGENARPLTETGADTGIFTGVYSFDAYTGTGDGYSLFTCISKINYGVYGWGAGEQYKMNGEAAGFGAVSIFKPTVTGKYLVTYTAATHVTTVEQYEITFTKPVIYGDFNSWAIEGNLARPLTETGTGTGIFTGTYHFDAYTGTGDGYSLFTCLSKINYGAYGWGAGLQYKMNGEAAGFGAVSIFKPTVSGDYLVTFNSSTHITTVVLAEEENPQTADPGIPLYALGMLITAAGALRIRKQLR